MYLWIKSFHIVFMVAWFAGLFYLPRLFVYHAIAEDKPSHARFKIMERKLFWGIMTPAGVLTIGCGLWLVYLNGGEWFKVTRWLHVKLAVAVLLIAYHVYLGRLVGIFRREQNLHSHVYYRWLNELPLAFLVAMVLLAELKPAW